MKQMAMKILKTTAVTSLIFLFFLLSGCSKLGIGGRSYTLDGVVNSAQVVPASSSTATGVITGYLDGSKNTMTGTLKWTGLSGSPTAIHIHGGYPGKNGYAFFIEVNIPTGTTDSLNFKSEFTESLEGGVGLSFYYFDIHTAAFPQGEIRGQIIAH
jgi:hypothetical protein